MEKPRAYMSIFILFYFFYVVVSFFFSSRSLHIVLCGDTVIIYSFFVILCVCVCGCVCVASWVGEGSECV